MKNRYQAEATSSIGIGLKVSTARSRVREYSSCEYGTATTSDVVFSMEISSLPVGGMITRIACGSTMRRVDSPQDMPSARAASSCPSSTLEIPARTISAMYADSFSARPITASQYAENRLTVLIWANCTANGMPRSICL